MKKFCLVPILMFFVCVFNTAPIMADDSNISDSFRVFIDKQEALHSLDDYGHATRVGFGQGKMFLDGQKVIFFWFASTGSDGNLEFTFDLQPEQLQRYMGVFARNFDKLDRSWQAWIQEDMVVVSTGNCWLWPDCQYREGVKPTPLYKALDKTIDQFKKLPMVKEMKAIHYYH